MTMEKNIDYGAINLYNEERNEQLLLNIKLVQLIGKAQDYAFHAYMIPDLNKERREEIFRESIEIFDTVIDSDTEIAHDAYIGKIQALYLHGERDQAYDFYHEFFSISEAKAQGVKYLFE